MSRRSAESVRSAARSLGLGAHAASAGMAPLLWAADDRDELERLRGRDPEEPRERVGTPRAGASGRCSSSSSRATAARALLEREVVRGARRMPSVRVEPLAGPRGGGRADTVHASRGSPRRSRGDVGVAVVALYKAGELGPVRMPLLSAECPRCSVARLCAADPRRATTRAGLALPPGREQPRGGRRRCRPDGGGADEGGGCGRALEARSAELVSERRERRRLLAVRARGPQPGARPARRAREGRARPRGDPGGAGRPTQRDAAAPRPGMDFAARRGGLRPPVDAPIGKGFGRVVDEIFQTETFRKGVEFAAAPARRCARWRRASCAIAGWFRGYGRLVIVDQGDELLHRRRAPRRDLRRGRRPG